MTASGRLASASGQIRQRSTGLLESGDRGCEGEAVPPLAVQ